MSFFAGEPSFNVEPACAPESTKTLYSLLYPVRFSAHPIVRRYMIPNQRLRGIMLRSRIPTALLMKQFDLKTSAYLALLVALGNARHWEVSFTSENKSDMSHVTFRKYGLDSQCWTNSCRVKKYVLHEPTACSIHK